MNLHLSKINKTLFITNLLLVLNISCLAKSEVNENCTIVYSGTDLIPSMREEDFIEAYNLLEQLEQENLLSEEDQKRRKYMLTIIFQSLQSPESPLYSVLLGKFIPLMYAENIQTIDTKSLNWKDFVDFLHFYKIGSERYALLPEPQKKFIQALNKDFGSLLEEQN